MKLTNNQIFALTEALAEVRNLGLSVPVKVGFKILKNFNILLPNYETIIKMRDEFATEYDENNHEESIAAINQKLIELGAIEQEIELIPILLSEIETLEMDMSLLDRIQLLIKDEA